MNRILSIIALCLSAPLVSAQAMTSQQVPCSAEQLAGRGYVQDAATAIAVTEAVSQGQGVTRDWLAKLRPFEARLEGSTWAVTSKLDRSIKPPKGIFARINRCSGAVEFFGFYPFD